MNRRLAWVVVVLVALLGVVGGVAWLFRGVQGAADLPSRLAGRGRVAVVGEREDLLRLGGKGTDLVMASEIAPLAEALAGRDPHALLDAMDGAEVGALLADGRGGGDLGEDPTLAVQLAAYGNVEGLAADYLAPAAALYLPSSVQRIEPPLDEALATVARGILEGSRPPRISSFPEPLRRMRNVEVMVMLRDRGRARLWRSARGSSIARALVTASSVARQRWQEREQAMGGPLDRRLPHMDVEVVLLEEDGTLGVRTPSFIERAFTPDHGVAYERRGAWRYLLPEATRSVGGGSPVQAYRVLFGEHGLEEDAFERADLRLYRLVARLLARSPAPEGTAAAAGVDPLEQL